MGQLEVMKCPWLLPDENTCRVYSLRLFGLRPLTTTSASMWWKVSEVSVVLALDGHNDGFLQRISTFSILLLGVLFISHCFVVSLGRLKQHFSFWSVIKLDSCRPLLSFTSLMFRVCLILECNSPNTPLPLYFISYSYSICKNPKYIVHTGIDIKMKRKGKKKHVWLDQTFSISRVINKLLRRYRLYL